MQKKKGAVIICAIVIIGIVGVLGLFKFSTKFRDHINVILGKPTTWEINHIDKVNKELKLPIVIDNKNENFILLENYTKIKIYESLLSKTKQLQNGQLDTLTYDRYLVNLKARMQKLDLDGILGTTKLKVEEFINNNITQAYNISQSAASEPISFYIQYAQKGIAESQAKINELQKKYKFDTNNQGLQNYFYQVEKILYEGTN